MLVRPGTVSGPHDGSGAHVVARAEGSSGAGVDGAQEGGSDLGRNHFEMQDAEETGSRVWVEMEAGGWSTRVRHLKVREAVGEKGKDFARREGCQHRPYMLVPASRQVVGIARCRPAAAHLPWRTSDCACPFPVPRPCRFLSGVWWSSAVFRGCCCTTNLPTTNPDSPTAQQTLTAKADDMV